MLALAGLLAGCGTLPGTGPTREADYTPTAATVVAFAAPFDPLRDPRSRDTYATSITGLRRALGELADCAAIPRSGVHLILADRVRVQSAEGDTTIDASEPGVVVLMDRARAPAHITLGAAPYPEARRLAARYFDSPACLPPKPEGD